MKTWIKRNKTEICILTLLSLFVSWFNYLQMHGCHIWFHDTDDFMRLVRMDEFFSGKSFFDCVIERANSPFGGELHWSRFYDLLWIIPFYVVKLFTHSTRQAVEIVGFVISPIMITFAGIVLLKAIQFLFEKKDSFLVIALLVTNPFIVVQSIFGRPDYHAFLITMLIIYMYFIIKMIRENFAKISTYTITGIVSALCVWASPETLIPLLVIDGMLFALSFKRTDILKALYFKTIIAATVMSILAYLNGEALHFMLCVFLIILLSPYYLLETEQFSKNSILKIWHWGALITITVVAPMLRTVQYDTLSCMHVVLYIYMALFFSVSLLYKDRKISDRLLFSVCWALIIGIIFLKIYPKFILGMGAEVSDYVKKIWLCRVKEMQSPLNEKYGISFCILAFINITAIAFKVKELMKQSVTAKNIAWWIFVATASCYTILGGCAYRMLCYTILFSCPLVVDFIMNGEIFQKLKRHFRVLIAIFAVLLVQFIPTGSFNHKKKDPKPMYTKQELFEVIDKISDTPVTIMAHPNYGPKLLWLTKHKIVSAPYHRHTHGIIAEYETMRNKYDEKRVKKYLRETDSDFILIVGGNYKNKNDGSFGRLIADHANYNGWIDTEENLKKKKVPAEIFKMVTIVKIPSKFKDIVLLKVNKDALK